MSDELFAIVFTCAAAALATLCMFPFGVAAGLALSRWHGRGSQILETLLSLPLVLPPTAVGLVLLQAFSPQGPVGPLISRFDIQVLFTWKAVVIATAVMSFPLLMRSAKAAFETVDPRLVLVGRSLGRQRAHVFLRVTLPLAWRGILAGTVLAFSRSLGEFGATIMVAGNIPGRTQTLALAIFHHVQMGNDSAAFRLGAITVILAFAAIWLSERLSRQRLSSPAVS